jgi:hypothetical protein
MGVAVGKYHLFKRTRKGKPFFYYWYEDSGRRVIKSCGRGCTRKREAVTFLEELFRSGLECERREKKPSSATINEFAQDMFTQDAPHLLRSNSSKPLRGFCGIPACVLAHSTILPLGTKPEGLYFRFNPGCMDEQQSRRDCDQSFAQGLQVKGKQKMQNTPNRARDRSGNPFCGTQKDWSG